MAATTFIQTRPAEPHDFRQIGQVEPTAWNSKSAAAWQKWFDTIEGGAHAMSTRMIELAQIGPGQRVLDVATGLGEPALSLALRWGPGVRVDAVDVSAAMLALAEQRAARLRLGSVAFREMTAENLTYPDETFDAILCRWGLMFVEDLPQTLIGFRRCLVPGGRLSVAAWGPPERAPAVSLGTQVVRGFLGLPPPDRGPGTPFALSDARDLRCTVENAGFADVRVEWVTVEFPFESAAAFVEFRKDQSQSLIADIAHFAKAEQDAAWHALAEAAQRYAGLDGTLRIPNAAYCLTARRP